MIEWKEDEIGTKEWLFMIASKFGLRKDIDIRNVKMFFSSNHLKVFYSEDNTPKWGWLKHLSISREDRYPAWDEIIKTKERFLGDIAVAMIIPKREDYINVHENCFHLWEIPGEWGIR